MPHNQTFMSKLNAIFNRKTDYFLKIYFKTSNSMLLVMGERGGLIEKERVGFCSGRDYDFVDLMEKTVQ